MKIAIQTFGTRGDVEPYVALALTLQERGHDVWLSVPVDFVDWVRGFGLTVKPINLDMGAYIRRAEALGITRNVLKAFKHSDEMIQPMLDAVVEAGIEHTRGAEVVIAHPKTLFSDIGAEREGACFIMAAPLPIITPTKAFPMPGTFARNHGAFWNRLTWMPLKFAMAPYRKRINAERAAQGLEPVGSAIDYSRYMNRPALQLLANSPSIIRRPEDWSDKAVITGSWPLPTTDDPLDEELNAFLNAGVAPVYIGFGSMVTGDASRLVKAAVKGLKKAGLRGVIARGWAELPESPGAHVHFIDGAPHATLFPRCCAIVHHGGAGTTAAALRAGRPSLIVPFMVDQPWWAERLFEQGLGPRALKPGRFNAGRFSRALKRLARNEAFRSRCEAVARQMAEENGTARAADLIEAEARAWFADSPERAA